MRNFQEKVTKVPRFQLLYDIHNFNQQFQSFDQAQKLIQMNFSIFLASRDGKMEYDN